MKKALLASSAIIAAGVIAAPAMAAEKKAAGPIKLGVGGYFHALGVHSNQDTTAGANLRSFAIAREAEISFAGSTTLDNGITAGVNVQLEAETCGDQIDESYIWFKGSFGEVNIGSENGVGNKSFRGSSVPLSGWVSTWTSNFKLYNNVGANTASSPFRSDVSSDSEKLTYWSPKMGGFQIGASYTWERQELTSSYGAITTDNGATGATTTTLTAPAGGGTVTSATTTAANTGQNSDVWELGATYSGNTGKDGVSYNVSGAYIRSNNEVSTAGTADKRVWALGADVSMAGWKVAGGYGNDNTATSGSNTDRIDWNVGVGYGAGAMSYGVSYSHTEVEAGAAGGADERDHWIAAASYAFGPGISFSAGVEHVSLDDNLNVAANEGDSTGIILGTSLFF
jgi:outer membrane protein OmpU